MKYPLEEVFLRSSNASFNSCSLFTSSSSSSTLMVSSYYVNFFPNEFKFIFKRFFSYIFAGSKRRNPFFLLRHHLSFSLYPGCWPHSPACCHLQRLLVINVFGFFIYKFYKLNTKKCVFFKENSH